MKKLSCIFLLGLLISCKKSPAPPTPPTKVILTLPIKDETCTTGSVISDDLSSIVFKWNKSDNTNSYELTIKNLENNQVINKSTAGLELSVPLSRNTPYSWHVTSKSAVTELTAQSETWKFYNAGAGITSYAPFPAEILTPKNSERVTAIDNKITLEWKGSDVDNDIANYTIYFGTIPDPPLLKSNHIESRLTNIHVTVGTTYYWKIITKDMRGNTADSGISIFYTN